VGLDARGHTVSEDNLARWKGIFRDRKRVTSVRSILLDVSANFSIAGDFKQVPWIKTLDVLNMLAPIVKNEKIEIGRFPIGSFETSGFSLNRYHTNINCRRPFFRKFDFYYPFVKAVSKLADVPNRTMYTECFDNLRCAENYLAQRKNFDEAKLKMLDDIAKLELCARFEVTCEAKYAQANLEMLRSLPESIVAVPVPFEEFYSQISTCLQTINLLRQQECENQLSAQSLLRFKALEEISQAVFSGNFRMLYLSPLGKKFVHMARVNNYFDEEMLKELLAIESKGNFLNIKNFGNRSSHHSVQKTVEELAKLHDRILVK